MKQSPHCCMRLLHRVGFDMVSRRPGVRRQGKTLDLLNQRLLAMTRDNYVSRLALS
jgi:hypothetical protein